MVALGASVEQEVKLHPRREGRAVQARQGDEYGDDHKHKANESIDNPRSDLSRREE